MGLPSSCWDRKQLRLEVWRADQSHIPTSPHGAGPSLLILATLGWAESPVPWQGQGSVCLHPLCCSGCCCFAQTGLFRTAMP